VSRRRQSLNDFADWLVRTRDIKKGTVNVYCSSVRGLIRAAGAADDAAALAKAYLDLPRDRRMVYRTAWTAFRDFALGTKNQLLPELPRERAEPKEMPPCALPGEVLAALRRTTPNGLIPPVIVATRWLHVTEQEITIEGEAYVTLLHPTKANTSILIRRQDLETLRTWGYPHSGAEERPSQDCPLVPRTPESIEPYPQYHLVRELQAPTGLLD
jgi:hypothetical protein